MPNLLLSEAQNVAQFPALADDDVDDIRRLYLECIVDEPAWTEHHYLPVGSTLRQSVLAFPSASTYLRASETQEFSRHQGLSGRGAVR